MDGFEWDEEKRRRNLEDHRVDFRLAARIFRNTVIEARDQRGRYDEPNIAPWVASATSTSSSPTRGAAATAA